MTGNRRAWSVGLERAEADALHRPWPGPGEEHTRHVVRRRVRSEVALVLGSTQRWSPPSAPAPESGAGGWTGGRVVHRATGGGAVLVGPDRQVWVDFWLPRGDPLWDDDVVRASRWVGDVWDRALRSLGTEPASVSVHAGGAERTPLASLVCFAGRGPGEVSVNGRKVVGVSQRRTRRGAWFQTTAPLEWDAALLVEAVTAVGLVAAGDGVSARDLQPVATGLRAAVGQEWRGVASSELVARGEDAVIAALAATT